VDVDQDSAKVTFPPPFIYVGMLLLGLALDRITPWSLELPWIARYIGGVIFIAAALFVGFSASSLFRKAGTDVKPWKATTAIVESGVYRFTRNPMYLGMAMLYAGLGILFSSLGIVLLLPVLIQVIAREERYLEGKFGEDYRAYKARVRRWL
jgi:protein-S-isoprenylcysteine O-methyltransferase Ste14